MGRDSLWRVALIPATFLGHNEGARSHLGTGDGRARTLRKKIPNEKSACVYRFRSSLFAVGGGVHSRVYFNFRY